MLSQSKRESRGAVQLLGECHPLLEQLGSADGLFTLTGVAASLRLPEVNSLESLAQFLETYQSQLLLPLEWPAIQRAHDHASRNEVRGLITLDLEIAGQN